MYNILPYSYSGPIVNHIVHFGPLLPRGVKGVGMPSVKKMILVVSNKVAQDKLFGVGMTLQ